MSYSKLNPQPTGLQPEECAVQLETGDIVAVSAISSMNSTSNNLVTVAYARVINQDGTDVLDSAGHPMATIFSHSSNDYELTTLGNGDPDAGAQTVKKCAMLAVLGEDTSPMWEDPVHMTALANANIRVNIQNAAHIGPVNAASLL